MDRPLRTDAALRAQIAERLQGFAVQPATSAERRAAVAVVVADAGHGPELPGLPQHTHWSDDGALLLTRRAEGMRQHAGQWAPPGGRIDAGETPEAAALRELHEEIGLHLDATAVLGRLDDYVTRSGYAITPVVLWAGAARTLQPNPEEVASIHRIPFSEWLRADAPILETTPHSVHPVLKMPVGRAWIAAPTAAIVYQFCELCLRGRPTRVAHFDQPAFAWR